MRPLTADQVETMILAAMDADDWATVADLEPKLDRLTQHKPEPSLLDVALWYAQLALHVFPLQPGQKIPHRGTRGCKDATNNPDQIKNWWQRWPDSNVGIATGHLVDVIDIDGPAGAISWARSKKLPVTSDPDWNDILGTVATPRPGGTHLYVAASGRGNRAAIDIGIDYRGAGGYVVAPPSVNTDGLLYRWRKQLVI
jgi:hypothetical protein